MRPTTCSSVCQIMGLCESNATRKRFARNCGARREATNFTYVWLMMCDSLDVERCVDNGLGSLVVCLFVCLFVSLFGASWQTAGRWLAAVRALQRKSLFYIVCTMKQRFSMHRNHRNGILLASSTPLGILNNFRQFRHPRISHGHFRHAYPTPSGMQISTSQLFPTSPKQPFQYPTHIQTTVLRLRVLSS